MMLILAFCLSVCQAARSAEPSLLYEVVPAVTEIDFGGKLFVEAALTNRGNQSVTVYWGDYAYPAMYRFDIVHLASRQAVLNTRLPVWNDHVPSSAEERKFKTLEPGETVRYKILLSALPAANGQYVFFRRPGKHRIQPSLQVTTDAMLDAASGAVLDRDDAWAGSLTAEAFTIDVRPPGPDLDVGTDISGTVVTADGDPVPRAIVQLYRKVPSFGSWNGMVEQIVDQTRADANGKYQFQRVPADSLSYRLVGWAPDRPANATTVPNDDSTRFDAVDINLPDGITMRGRVVDSQGLPLRDVRVSSQMLTGEDGRFSVVVPKDRTPLSVDLWRRGFVGISVQTDKQTATGGKWQIEMYSEQSVRVRGTATYVDGQPVSDSNLVFTLKPIGDQNIPNRQVTEIRCDTDSDGGFAATLPAPAEYTATAKALKRNDSGIGREWTCEVDRLSTEAAPLKLRFDNRGSIQVKLTSTSELPESQTLVVNCFSGQNHRLVAQQKVAADARQVIFDRLAPGAYRVEVSLEQAKQNSWARMVIVPSQTPFAVSAQFTIPALKFGGIKARFLMPDGVTPAAFMKVWLATEGGGLAVTTDQNGGFRATDLLAGPIQLTPGAAPGVAQVPIRGHQIEGSRITYLGTVTLKHVDDEFGLLEGTLQSDDGRKVGPAQIAGLYAGIEGGGVMIPSMFRAEAVDVNGDFQVRLPKGKQKIVINLGLATPIGGFVTLGGQESKRLILDADIQAGKTTTRNVMLQHRREHAEVTVSWKKPDQNLQLVGVVEQAGLLWVSTLYSSGQASAYTFKRVPAGKFYVLARDYSQPYFSLRSLPEDAAQQTIELGSPTGELLVSVSNAANKQPIKDLGITVTALLAKQPVFVCSVPAKAAGRDNETARGNRMFQQLNDGTMRIRGITAGEYQLTVSDGQWQQRREVVLTDLSKPLRVSLTR
jgi:hypothetical protein